jgi:hypothetical protein
VRRLLAPADAGPRGLPEGSLQRQSLSLAHGLFYFSFAHASELATLRKNKKARPAKWRGQALSLVGVRTLLLFTFFLHYYDRHFTLVFDYQADASLHS